MCDKGKTMDIIGVELFKGAGYAGIEMGARAVRHMGLHKVIAGHEKSFRDHGDITPACALSAYTCGGGESAQSPKSGVAKLNSAIPAGFVESLSMDCSESSESNQSAKTENPQKHDKAAGRLNSLAEVNEINTKLYQKVRESLIGGGFPLIIGGDHALAAGSITAAADHFGDIGVIWVDAHGDFNDDSSSPSGNIHGMPLSAVTGCGPNQIIPFKDKDGAFVKPTRAVLVGIRSLDEEERERIASAGVTVFTAEDIRALGIARVMEKAAQIASNGTHGVYLSFDMDSIDPSFAPGVSTPEAGGITDEDARFICRYAAANTRLLAAEIVELNPLRDHCARTAALVVELAAAIIGARNK